MVLHREVALARADEVVEVVVDKVFPLEEEVVGQREVQVVQRVQVDHLRVHLRQIRTTLDAMRAIITTPPGYVHTQISNAMFAERRDIYTGTVLGRVSLVDNKARIPRHPT